MPQVKIAMGMEISTHTIMLRWKLTASLPCRSTNLDVSFFTIQQMIGPSTLMVESAVATMADRWQNMAHCRSSGVRPVDGGGSSLSRTAPDSSRAGGRKLSGLSVKLGFGSAMTGLPEGIRTGTHPVLRVRGHRIDRDFAARGA